MFYYFKNFLIENQNYINKFINNYNNNMYVYKYI